MVHHCFHQMFCEPPAKHEIFKHVIYGDRNQVKISRNIIKNTLWSILFAETHCRPAPVYHLVPRIVARMPCLPSHWLWPFTTVLFDIFTSQFKMDLFFFLKKEGDIKSPLSPPGLIEWGKMAKLPPPFF